MTSLWAVGRGRRPCFIFEHGIEYAGLVGAVLRFGPVFNYPHYTATIYRAYRRPEDFEKYRIFSVHTTALIVLTLVISHYWTALVPTPVSLFHRIDIPQTRYATGVMAVMRSAQYLWITSCYARREAAGEGKKTGPGWRPLAYFGVLMVGGIALFVPGHGWPAAHCTGISVPDFLFLLRW